MVYEVANFNDLLVKCISDFYVSSKNGFKTFF